MMTTTVNTQSSCFKCTDVVFIGHCQWTDFSVRNLLTHLRHMNLELLLAGPTALECSGSCNFVQRESEYGTWADKL